MIAADILIRVEIRLNSKFGRVLHALADVAVGEEVFAEEPILLTFSETTDQEEMLLRRVSEKSGMNLLEDFVFVKSFCEATDEARSLVLDCYSPPLNEVSRSVLLTGLMKVVDVAKTYKWSANFDKETLRKVVLIKACNAHGYYSQSSSAAALYTFGSKLRHSCVPNVVYTSQRRSDGKGSFVAKKRIHSGDGLFISYISIFQSTIMRNLELLENYLFTCDCSLCTKGIDFFRGRKCTFCTKGTQYLNQVLDEWDCDLCENRGEKTSSEFIFFETKIVKDTEEFLRSFHGNIPGSVDRKILELRSSLGPNHGITKKLEKKNLQNLSSLVKWAKKNESWIDFFDSSLIEIACKFGRNGEYDKAIEYLEPVLIDMNILFGEDNNNVEQQNIVRRAIKACLEKKRDKVPQLESSEEGCPMQ